MTVKRSGFIAIVGRPNVGKSTLLNYMVGEKLAGVSSKPQTTRGVVRGILTKPEGQLVFLDTPGFHKPQDKLGNWMLKEISDALAGADLVYWLVLPGKINPIEIEILQKIKDANKPTILLINQVDRFAKEEILPVLEHYGEAHEFKEMIPISALTGLQVDIVTKKSFENLPECEYLFPEDQISDQNVRYLVTELLREKVFQLTRNEIPYDTAVVIDDFIEREDGIAEVHATFIVERDSQKGIIIGKNGQMMKDIGQKAREDMENLLQKKVFLKLWVKTMDSWKDDSRSLRHLGFH
jgi:GTP-binding protein Era